jgi:hypothetical protein
MNIKAKRRLFGRLGTTRRESLKRRSWHRKWLLSYKKLDFNKLGSNWVKSLKIRKKRLVLIVVKTKMIMK